MVAVLLPGNMNSSSGFDLIQNLDSLKESLRLAGTGSYSWQDIDISQFQGTKVSVLSLFKGC